MYAERRFNGVMKIYGTESLSKFNQAHICVIGVGGVGSWVVEALARSGIGNLNLIDLDHIVESNINRQIQALESTFGQAKVVALINRIKEINPAIQVTPQEIFIEPSNLDQLIHSDFNLVLDCIDNSYNKAALLAYCLQKGIKVISVGGAGGRRNPFKIKVADLNAVGRDKLLAKTRNRMRQEFGCVLQPKQPIGIQCVYSDEPQMQTCNSTPIQAMTGGLQCNGYGSVVTVTATFGFMAAALALEQLAKI